MCQLSICTSDQGVRLKVTVLLLDAYLPFRVIISHYRVGEQDHLRQQKYEGTGYGQGSLFRVPFQAGLLRSLET